MGGLKLAFILYDYDIDMIKVIQVKLIVMECFNIKINSSSSSHRILKANVNRNVI